MRAAQEEAAERQQTRKKEKPYHFQKKGHEEQFAFNDGVADNWTRLRIIWRELRETWQMVQPKML